MVSDLKNTPDIVYFIVSQNQLGIYFYKPLYISQTNRNLKMNERGTDQSGSNLGGPSVSINYLIFKKKQFHSK